MKTLRRTQFGNPILRRKARQLSKPEILSNDTQHFIDRMYYTLENKKYGVGLAAPQVGLSLAICVIGIKTTPTRPDLKQETFEIINPKIVKTYGEARGMYEACISVEKMYAQALRYKKIRLRWLDRHAKPHERDFSGFTAHVLQHEVDHLNGVLYVDRVKDTTTYMTESEYARMRKKQQASKAKA